MFDPSPIHIILLLLVVPLVFGTKRLPEIGRSLGKGIREFKGTIDPHYEAEPPVTATAAEADLSVAPRAPAGSTDAAADAGREPPTIARRP